MYWLPDNTADSYTLFGECHFVLEYLWYVAMKPNAIYFHIHINASPFLLLLYYSYNIRYGKVSCTEQEVYDAASASDIHEKIEIFPDGEYISKKQ